MCDHDFVLGCMFKNRLTILTRIQFNSNFSDHGASDMLESREREAGTKASQKKYFQILIMRRCKGKDTLSTIHIQLLRTYSYKLIL